MKDYKLTKNKRTRIRTADARRGATLAQYPDTHRAIWDSVYRYVPADILRKLTGDEVVSIAVALHQSYQDGVKHEDDLLCDTFRLWGRTEEDDETDDTDEIDYNMWLYECHKEDSR